MKLLKEKRRMVYLMLTVIMICIFAGCDKKGINDLIEEDVKNDFMEVKYFDGEKTECYAINNEDEQQICDELKGLKIKSIPLETVSKMKSPCLGIEFKTGHGENEKKVAITISDGMLLKGIEQKLDTEGEIDYKREYELYEVDYDFKSVFDKYKKKLEEEREEWLEKEREEDATDDYYEDYETEYEEDEGVSDFIEGGISMTNSMLLCKYNKEFYQEEKNDITNEKNGVSINEVEMDRDKFVLARIKNNSNELVEIQEKYIQKKIGDKWYTLPTEPLDDTYNYEIRLVSSKEDTIEIPLNVYDKLQSGKYRVVVEYCVNGEAVEDEDGDYTCPQIDYEVASEFDVN